MVSSPAVAVGGLAAGPDERGRDHCRAASFTARVVQVSFSRYRVSWIATVADGIELDAAREVARPRLFTCRFVAHG